MTSTPQSVYAPPDYPPSNGRLLVMVLVASGTIGLIFGLARPSWQDALEPAQVLAGIVRYPADNPQYLYATRTWTVIHQILALGLRWGASERTLAIAVSGFQGMISLQALAVFILALSGDASLAILGSFFIYFTNASRGGVLYPVILMGSPYTYGVIGLSYVVLMVALIGVGQLRAGALLLGFGPAVHPSLGLLGLVTVIAAMAFDRPSSRHRLIQATPFLVAGASLCILSAVAHYGGLRADVGFRLLARDWSAPLPFVGYWEGHRGSFPLYSGGMLLVWLSAGLATLWLWRFLADVPVHARLLLKILIASMVVGVAMSISYWLPSTWATHVLYASMPSRLLNLNVMTCMALTIGLLGRYRDSLSIQIVLALLVVACCVFSMVNSEQATGARIGMSAAGCALVVLTFLRHRHATRLTPPPWVVAWVRRTGRVVIAAVLLSSIGLALTDIRPLDDGADDGLFAAARTGEGLLLTAGDLHRIQLHTRRPVLLDGGALDEMVYVPQGAQLVDRILRSVYGFDTSHSEGWPDADKERGLWEARTTAVWQGVQQQFRVSDVLTYSGWTLKLPVIAHSSHYTLYRIP